MDVMRSFRVPRRPAEGGTSVRAAGRQVGTRIGCALIVSAAAVMLGLSIHHGLQGNAGELNPGAIKAWARFDRQEECIYHAIRSELPKGATIYIDDPVAYDAQRLAELSTLWAVPQSRAPPPRVGRFPWFPGRRAPGSRWRFGTGEPALFVLIAGLGMPGLLPALAVARRSPALVFLAPLIGAGMAAVAASSNLA